MARHLDLETWRGMNRRIESVRKAGSRRLLREAEAVVGMPFHGCVWHNAAVSAAEGRPWAEFGIEKVRAYKRFQYLDERHQNRCRELADRLYARMLRDEYGYGKSA